MSDRALIVAAFIIGGAIIASSFQTHVRYSLSAADSNVAWRMDTWSGQIDICAAAYLPTGPIVRCGVTVVNPQPAPPANQAPGANPPAPGDAQTPPIPTSPRDRL